jgi:hypothetical protein
MTTIVTTSWFSKLDPDVYTRIGISRGALRGQSGFRRYAKLNPGVWFNSVGPEEYRNLYYAEVLDRLDPKVVVADLLKLADGRVPALCCFEPASDPLWCHRALVSSWLSDTLGLAVFEIGREDDGYGWSHPKLPAEFRRPR